MKNENLFKKVRQEIFIKYNPKTLLWKLTFLWRNFPPILKSKLIKQFGYLYSRNVQYFGEFGYELLAVIPYAYWLKQRDILNSTLSVEDTKCLYYFSKSHFETKIKRRTMGISDFPLTSIHTSNLDTYQWYPPPYKKVYKNKIFRWNKPICIICNKYTSEWGGVSKDIPDDDQIHLSFDDFTIIKNHFSNIITIQDLVKKHNNLTFNELQLKLYSNCNNFISVQGGSSVLASYFGGKNIIFAKKGGEVNNNSYSWFHKLSGAKIFHENDNFKLIETIKNEFL
ncbi:MAG: hypothetical protein P8Y97_14420 [Candidatus Lokiarchaeota archaeon]